MAIYIFLFSVVIILYLILKDKKNGKRNYCFIIGIVLSLIAGLRNETLGLTDTQYVYKVFFERILVNDFEYVLTLKDTLFQIITFVFTRIFGNNFKLYVLLFTTPYIAAVTFLIYKYSKRKWLSFIIFICLHYYEISFTLMRQINGMAILIWAFYNLLENKKMRFILLTVLASCFHSVCIIYLFLYPLRNIKININVLIIVLIIVTIFSMFPKEILNVAYNIIDNERFDRYQELNRVKNRVFFIMNLVFWIVEMLNYKNIYKDKTRTTMLWCVLICLIISPLTVALGETSRIAYLFGVMHIILLPDSIDLIKSNRQKMILELGMATTFILYFLFFLGPQVNIIPYFI